jgi:hypothetical protein
VKDISNGAVDYTKVHPDAVFIKQAGDPTRVARALNAMFKPVKPLTQPAVNQWRYRGVAPAWRAGFAKLCKSQGIDLPKDWLNPDAKERHAAEAMPAPQAETPAYLEAV